MTLRPVAGYLTRFEDQIASFDVEPPPFDPSADRVEFDKPDATQPDADAIEAAVAQARLDAKREYDEKLAEEKNRYADMLQSERQRWVAEEGARLAELFHTSLEGAVEQIQASFARALTPFVARNILDRLLREFVDTVKIAMEKGNDSTIRLSGPKDLLDIVEVRLGELLIAIERIETADDEVRAIVGATSIETCIAPWLQKLDRGVGQDG